jgi:hypothetical protein
MRYFVAADSFILPLRFVLMLILKGQIPQQPSTPTPFRIFVAVMIRNFLRDAQPF